MKGSCREIFIVTEPSPPPLLVTDLILLLSWTKFPLDDSA